MPSTNKTPNIGIGQYLPNDILSWDDINADNAIVDEAIAGRLDKTAGGTVSGAVDFTGGLTKNGNPVPDTEIGTFVLGIQQPNGLGISERTGSYYRIGKRCFIDARILFSGTGLPATDTILHFINLPFPAKTGYPNTNMGTGSAFVSHINAGAYNSTQMGAVAFKYDVLRVQYNTYDTAGSYKGWGALTSGKIMNKTEITFQFWYEIA